MWNPDRIKSIRKGFEMTQEQFCELLDVPVGTLRDWEQGRVTPKGPALKLLGIYEQRLRDGNTAELQSV